MSQFQDTSITGSLIATTITSSFTGSGSGITGITSSIITNFIVDVVSASKDTFDIQQFTTTGAGQWIKPTTFDPKFTMIVCVGGGGGGGSGACNTVGNLVTTVRLGGAGGGGGAINTLTIPSSQLAATESLYVGNGGTGGPARPGTVATAGLAGGSGESSSFGSYVRAGGGGGGCFGTNVSVTSTSGGGGGGTHGNGQQGTTNTAVAGGTPGSTTILSISSL